MLKKNYLPRKKKNSFPKFNRYSQKTIFSFLSLIIMAIVGALSTPANNVSVNPSYKCKEYASKEQYNDAINCYTDVINKDHSNEDYDSRAEIYFKIGKLDEALADINSAISIDKHIVAYFFLRAKIYEKKKMYNEAIADYSKYINNDKKNPDYMGVWGRGKCYYYLKDYDKAIQDFSQSIKIKPDDINLYSWRSDCYYLKNDFANAAKDYEAYTSRTDIQFNGFYQLGICYIKLGENEKAKAIYNKLLNIDPSIEKYFTGDHTFDFFDLDLRRKSARQYLNDANVILNDTGSVTSKSMLEIKLNDAFEKLQIAWSYTPNSTGINDEHALQDSIISKLYYIYPLLKTKPAVPEYVRKFTVQATSYVDDKNYSQAVQLYQRALGVIPYYPLAHFNVAMLFATMKDYRSAILYMKNYLKLAPEAPDARAAQDKIYEWEVKTKN